MSDDGEERVIVSQSGKAAQNKEKLKNERYMDANVKQYIIGKLRAWGFTILYLVAWFFVAGFVSMLLSAFPVSSATGSNVSLLFSSAAMLAAAILVTWIFCKFIHHETLADIGLGFFTERWKDLLSGMLYGVAAVAIGFSVCYAAGFIGVKEIQFSTTMLVSLAMFILVAFNEEIMFRGYVLRRFMSGYNKYAALVISSILFMLMHGFNGNITFLGLFNIFLAGVLLGMYYIHQQNLWFPIGLHFTWNFFQGPVFDFAVSGTETSGAIITQQPTSGGDWLTGGAFGFEGSLLCTLLVIVMIVAVHLQYRKKNIPVNTY